MARASLRFASDLLKRLGEELNPSPVNGIIELVKNAYDADSPRCDVTLRQPIDASAPRPGSLVIEDWGDGMTQRDFLDGWLVLGKSRKQSNRPTRMGRFQVGDKGLGRLSALRMGSRVRVVSRPRSQPGREFELEIDWAKYHKTVTPNQVPLNVKSRRVDRNLPSGTRIEISGISTRLDSMEIQRLSRGLLLIANPFEDLDFPFVVNLVIEPKPRTKLPTLQRLFDAASLRLEGSVGSNGALAAKLFDSNGARLAVATSADLRRRFQVGDPQDLVPLKFVLWIYILREDHFEGGQRELAIVRSWLREFGGVHVFVNGVRVAPYGDPEDDWTGMNALRASSPELAPQTRTSIGYVAISDQHGLRQKTDRSGFIESPTVIAIREFTRACLRWQQSFRVRLRDSAEQIQKSAAEIEVQDLQEKIVQELSTLEQPPRANLQALFKRFVSARVKNEASLKREIDLYRTLGTAGIAASVFAHEAAHNPLSRIKDGVSSIAFKVKREDKAFFDRSISNVVQGITRDVIGLEGVAAITLTLVRARKRKRQRVSLNGAVAEIVDVFKPYLVLSNVSVEVRTPKEDLAIYGTRASVECVLVNLLTNALQAFDLSGKSGGKIRFSLSREGTAGILNVMDDGPGIKDIPLEDIWLPGETTREEGTGLGLAIVRAAVNDLGGSIHAVENSELGGAGFTLLVPLLREH